MQAARAVGWKNGKTLQLLLNTHNLHLFPGLKIRHTDLKNVKISVCAHEFHSGAKLPFSI